jgi:hypothetical protein
MEAEVAAIFDRLRTSPEARQARLKKLSAGRMFGRCFAARRATVRAVAERMGVHRLANLRGCATV